MSRSYQRKTGIGINLHWNNTPVSGNFVINTIKSQTVLSNRVTPIKRSCGFLKGVQRLPPTLFELRIYRKPGFYSCDKTFGTAIGYRRNPRKTTARALYILISFFDSLRLFCGEKSTWKASLGKCDILCLNISIARTLSRVQILPI